MISSPVIRASLLVLSGILLPARLASAQASSVAAGPVRPALPLVAVMPLVGEGIDSSASNIVTDALADELMRLGRVRVMERSQMEKILSEQGFQNSGACNGNECAVEVGRLLSIDRMVVGTLGKLGSSFTLSVRVVSVTTGEILGSSRRILKGEIEALVTQMLPPVAQELMARMEGSAPAGASPQVVVAAPESKPVVIDSLTGWEKRKFRVAVGPSLLVVKPSVKFTEGQTSQSGVSGAGGLLSVTGRLRVLPRLDLGAGMGWGFQSFGWQYTDSYGVLWTYDALQTKAQFLGLADFWVLPKVALGAEFGYDAPGWGKVNVKGAYGEQSSSRRYDMEEAPSEVSDSVLMSNYHVQGYAFFGARLTWQPTYRLQIHGALRLARTGILPDWTVDSTGTRYTLNDPKRTNNVLLNSVAIGASWVF